MDDLISRQAAIDELEERLQANGYSNVALVSELNRSIGYLMRLPSIDAVKHGRWKYISFLTVECSECKAQIHDLEYSNFCPNCGAKMDETVDE